jgi:molybdopterin converting factor small subunit
MAHILLFGKLAQAAGWRAKAWPLARPHTVAELRAALSADCPAIATLSNRAAVNRVLCEENTPVSDEDEVAFMPPMSGG